MKKRLRLGFKMANKQLFSNRARRPSDGMDAYTTGPISENDETPAEIWINIDVGIVEPLLRDDLTDAERFGLQYWIASIIVHECTHAYWHLIHSRRSGRISFVPMCF